MLYRRINPRSEGSDVQNKRERNGKKKRETSQTLAHSQVFGVHN